MVLEEYRETAEPYLQPVAERFKNTDPNKISWAAFACAVIAGICLVISRYYEFILILASVFIFFNAGLDALDGKIARMSSKASKKGDFLDHVLDRYADIIIISGVVLSPHTNTVIGVLALLGVILTSYMGTQAQAVGCSRNYRGLLGRADRSVILILAPLIQYVFLVLKWTSTISIEGLGNLELSFFNVVMILFAILGNATAIQRAIRTWKDLETKEKQ